MAWWGKIFGGGLGFMMGGPLGALIGAALGHQFDRGLQELELLQKSTADDTERTQAAFFTATFSIMGYLAKVDGQVSKDEIRLAEQVMTHMRLSSEQRKAAIELFNQGKHPEFPLDDVLQQFRQECHRRRNLMQMFLEILISTALADGNLHPGEHSALRHIGERMGFDRFQLEQLVEMIRAQQHFSGKPDMPESSRLSDAYAILGIPASSNDEEVKKAYRRLLSQHHPDKLVSKGLPEEMIKLATEKTHEIKTAFETIKQSRGRSKK
jgi:DnaJ like chaperone protein